MYDEILEAVCCLAEHLYGKLPRRKVELLCEELANLVVPRVQSVQSGGEESKPYLLTKYDPLLAIASHNVALNVQEVQELLPNQWIVSVSSTEVSERVDNIERTLWPNPTDFTDSLSSGLRQSLLIKVVIPTLFCYAPPRPNHVFELNHIDQSHFTVGSFAMTRFGSKRLRSTPLTLRYLQGGVTGYQHCNYESATPVVSHVPYEYECPLPHTNRPSNIQ